MHPLAELEGAGGRTSRYQAQRHRGKHPAPRESVEPRHNQVKGRMSCMGSARCHAASQCNNTVMLIASRRGLRRAPNCHIGDISREAGR